MSDPKVVPLTSGESGRLDVGDIAEAQVVVIGGGINGAATFRDLALQGVDVVLIERSDFSSGASSASSHMVHGGLRYLENGELRLVQESVRERNALLITAPHQVRPLPTTIPLRKTWSGAIAAPLRVLRHRPGNAGTERGAILAKLGLAMYDSYSRRDGWLPPHTMERRSTFERTFPDFAPDISWAATYYDASVGQPERVALDLVLDGVRAHDGARAMNYVEATGLDEHGVQIRDVETGARSTIAAAVVVNASGPWTDLTNDALGQSTEFMGGTKGSHIVVDSPELLAATRGHEIFFEHPDGRIVLIYPLHGRVMIGTTDIPFDPSEPAVCTSEEVDYFLDLVALVFPGIPLEKDQIVYRFSGIRPLPRAEDSAPGVVSRDYRLEHSSVAATKVVSIVGGKWTTFRALGERVADEVLPLIGAQRRRSTLREWIGGGRGYPKTPSEMVSWRERHLPGLDESRRDTLIERYGTRARDVATFLDSASDAIIPGTDLSDGEVRFMVRAEYARTVADVVQRRTTLAFRGGLTPGAVHRIAQAMAEALGWSPERTRDEADACMSYLEKFHGVAWAKLPHDN
ncbi:glycerol-3-phosphate dehydrogenase/oxidase [Demequina globuliformis]|uniref:glycerol-3-phosphate dehydrogenase/oxidase n=1 Tax=Demequina globuliformis TaxID=676202 RepID=UPI000780342C|nr:glycerol-3-phosphate dehydrogenase/oxidase [Demequina globuliformis]